MDVSRYSFEAQTILHYGLRYAKGLGHDELEVEHVLLAFLRRQPDHLDPYIYADLVRTLELYLQRFPKRFGRVDVTFGSRLNKALDLTEAKISSRPIEPQDLWPALIAQTETTKGSQKFAAKQIQSSLEFSSWQPQELAKDSVSKSIPAKGGPSERGVKSSPGKKLEQDLDQTLRECTSDLTELASQGKIDPVIGRDSEIRRVLEILGRKKKNNPILLGDPGVGKTAIAEGLALRVAADRVPDSLKGMRVLALDLSSLLAGTKYRGEFESRLRQIIKALESLQNRVVLFIDEIHAILGAGQAEGGADAANLLKPALARGYIRCIGATTLTEFRRSFEKDAALERRFQPIIIEEPNRESTLSILRGLKPRYEIHHGIPIADDALEAAVDLSLKHLPQRHLPDKAIDLLDEAASRVKLAMHSVPAELERLQAQAAQLKTEEQALEKQDKHSRSLAIIKVKLEKILQACQILERHWFEHRELLIRYQRVEATLEERKSLLEEAIGQSNFELAARLQYEEIPKLQGEWKELKQGLEETEKQYGFGGPRVKRQDIARVLEQWTGIPSGELLIDDKERLRELEGKLRERIVGQDEAISILAKAMRRSRLGLKAEGRPIGAFLFMGPTGVGKTETAKACAALLFGNEQSLVRIDMSEYMEPHHVSKLVGAPPGYAGYEQGSPLTDAVRHRPHTVVLFDEIEKAHPQVLDLLLQLLDEGRLTDSQGRLADFRHSLCLLTSNIILPLQAVQNAERDDYLRRELSQFLRPELVNRFDEIIPFKPLRKEHFKKLLEMELSHLNERLATQDIRLEIGDGLEERMILESLRSPFGGRELKRFFQRWVLDNLAERLLETDEKAVGAWRLNWSAMDGFTWDEAATLQRLLPPARS